MGPVSWNSSLNLSTNKNKVLALAPGQTQIIGSKGFSITEVGKSISELYGYEIIGIYKSDEDFKKYPAMAGTQIGDYIIKNQNDDNVINTKDKKSFGSPLPKVVLGWNNTFRYKSFELTLDLYSELGKKLYSTALSQRKNILIIAIIRLIILMELMRLLIWEISPVHVKKHVFQISSSTTLRTLIFVV